MSLQDFKKYFTNLEFCHLDPSTVTKEDLRMKEKIQKIWKIGMSYQDYEKCFTNLAICNSNPEEKKWKMSVFEDYWLEGNTAGGCRNHLEAFWRNPQPHFTLKDPDDGDDKCTVIVALMQKGRRSQRELGAGFLTIGFSIYHVRLTIFFYLYSGIFLEKNQ